MTVAVAVAVVSPTIGRSVDLEIILFVHGDKGTINLLGRFVIQYHVVYD